MSDANAKKEPTAAEAMLFFYILKNLRNKADIDWAAVAQDSRLKNADTAKTRFGQIKKKLGISSDPSPSPKKVGAASVSTPTKVTKKGGRAGSKASAQAQTPTSARSIVKQEQLEEQLEKQLSGETSPTFPSPSPIKREREDFLTSKGFDALMEDGDPF